MMPCSPCVDDFTDFDGGAYREVVAEIQNSVKAMQSRTARAVTYEFPRPTRSFAYIELNNHSERPVAQLKGLSSRIEAQYVVDDATAETLMRDVNGTGLSAIISKALGYALSESDAKRLGSEAVLSALERVGQHLRREHQGADSFSVNEENMALIARAIATRLGHVNPDVKLARAQSMLKNLTMDLCTKKLPVGDFVVYSNGRELSFSSTSLPSPTRLRA